jgi:hypothetical protein
LLDRRNSNLPRGDSAMPSLKTLVVLMVLFAIVAVPLRAGPTNSDGTKAPAPLDLAAVKGLLKDMQEQVNRSIESALNTKAAELRREVDSLRKDLEAQRTLGDPAVNALKKQTRDLEDTLRLQTAQLEDLKRGLNALKDRMACLEGNRPYTTARNPGTIRVFNTSKRTVSVCIDDGPATWLEPNQSTTLAPRAPGPFTYEVFGLEVPHRKTTDLKPGEQYDIEVFDPAVGPVKTRRQ